VLGSYVLTPPAVKSPVGRAHEQLAKARMWLWKILQVFAPGATLPPNNWHVQTVDVEVYEAQIHYLTNLNRYRQPRVGGFRGARQNTKKSTIQIMLLVFWREYVFQITAGKL
jgi:hypothetical protein